MKDIKINKTYVMELDRKEFTELMNIVDQIASNSDLVDCMRKQWETIRD